MSRKNKNIHLHMLYKVDNMQDAPSSDDHKNLILDSFRNELLAKGCSEEDAEKMVQAISGALYVAEPLRIF